MKHHFDGKQRLVVAIRPAVAFAGHISLREHCHDTGYLQSRRRVNVSDDRMSMRREHGPRMQKVWKSPAQIVDIEGFACDVSAGAFVRERSAGHLHSRCSH
jgi:hypothetical protein